MFCLKEYYAHAIQSWLTCHNLYILNVMIALSDIDMTSKYDSCEIVKMARTIFFNPLGVLILLPVTV